MRQLALLGLLLLIGCENKPVATTQSSNTKVPVDLLFEHDGCKVYRFEDGGYPRYYAKCSDSYVSTMSVHHEGKVTVPDSIPTGGIQ